MTFLKNISYVVLGAGIGIATVYLARHFLSSSSSNKKSKTNEDKNTKVYVIPISPQINQKENDSKENERKLGVPTILVQNQRNEEPIIDETVKTIIDGIALIQDQSKTLSEVRRDKSIDQVYSVQVHQNNEEPVSGGNINQTQNQNNEESNNQEKTYKRKNTSIYLISTTQGDKKGELEVSTVPVQSRSNKESTIDKSINAIVDGIALIQNQTQPLLNSQEIENNSTNPDNSIQRQNAEEPVSGGNTYENLTSINQTPVQTPNDAVLNQEEKEKTIKKIFPKMCGKEIVGNVVLEYVETGEDKQLNNEWKANFQSIEESSGKYEDANSRFMSIPSEEVANEKLNSPLYESYQDKTKYVAMPFKPPRIRKTSKSESFGRSKFSKTISTISSRKPSAQSTFLEAVKKTIEVKEADNIKVLAEESNSTFQSDNFHIESRHKTLGHQLWRRYAYAFGNLFTWKKRAGDKSKLLDSSHSTENYANKNNLMDLIEDDEANFKKYKKFK